jgi:hypothetical protein
MKKTFIVWKVDAIGSNTAPFLGIASHEERDNAILYYQ